MIAMTHTMFRAYEVGVHGKQASALILLFLVSQFISSFFQQCVYHDNDDEMQNNISELQTTQTG